MHELSLTQNLVNIILKHAETNKASQVMRVSLKIGELRDIADEWMQRYFDYISRGTIAEGATLKIERSPIIFRCQCGETFSMNIDTFRDAFKESGNMACPFCGGEKIVLDRGQEFYILGIEVK